MVRTRLSRLVGTVLAIVVVIMSAASFALPWYHHYTRQSIDSIGSMSFEHLFYLQGLTARSGSSSESGSYDSFAWTGDSLSSFMNLISVLVVVGVMFSIAFAAFLTMGRRKIALVSGSASLLVLMGSAIVFFIGLGNALPSDYEFVSFFSDTTTNSLFLTTHEVWGPLAGWWIVLVAVVVQFFALVFAALSDG